MIKFGQIWGWGDAKKDNFFAENLSPPPEFLRYPAYEKTADVCTNKMNPDVKQFDNFFLHLPRKRNSQTILNLNL